MSRPVEILPVVALPEITSDSDLAAVLVAALGAGSGSAPSSLRDGDLLVVSSKLVSKAGGLRHPATTDRLALIRSESTRVVAERLTPGGLTQVVESVAGPVLAAAGVDASNTGPDGGFLLLPRDPDAAAAELHHRLRAALERRCQDQGRPAPRFGLVLSDTAGRPWREGQTDFALGAHGVRVLDDLRGGNHVDADGRALSVTARAVGDELAAAADLVKGKTGGIGAALIRGLPHLVLAATDHGASAGGADGGAAQLTRTGPGDWFALGHREAVRAALGAPPGTRAAEQVGLPSVLPETIEERGVRAVRLALLGSDGSQVQVHLLAEDGDPRADGVRHGHVGHRYAVHASRDPVLAGRVAARLEVALAGEGLEAPVRVVSDPAAD